MQRGKNTEMQIQTEREIQRETKRKRQRETDREIQEETDKCQKTVRQINTKTRKQTN